MNNLKAQHSTAQHSTAQVLRTATCYSSLQEYKRLVKCIKKQSLFYVRKNSPQPIAELNILDFIINKTLRLPTSRGFSDFKTVSVNLYIEIYGI